MPTDEEFHDLLERVEKLEALLTAGPAKRFRPPTLEEVDAYRRERGIKASPQSFMDFYESKGWVVGPTSMKDWRAAFRRSATWETNRLFVASGEDPADRPWPAVVQAEIDAAYAAEQTVRHRVMG